MAIQPVEQGSAFAFRNVINNNFYELKVLSGASKPTQSTAAVVGQMYLDTSEGKMYFCSNVSGSVYTWRPFSEFSGSYNDLEDKPSLFSGNYNDLTNKPDSSKISYNNNLSSLEADNVQKAIDEIISLKAVKNGFATLDSSGKVPSVQLPSMNYIPNSQKGVANGVATLNSNSKLTDSQMPSLIEYPTYSLSMPYGEYSSGEISCIIIQRKICILTGYALFKGHSGTTVALYFDSFKIGEKYYKPKLDYSDASVSGKSHNDQPYGALDPLSGLVGKLGRGFRLTTILENLSLEADNVITFSAIFEVE